MKEFISSHKLITALVVLFVLITSTLFTVAVLKQQQDQRSRASGETVTLNFSPANQNIAPNTEFDVQLTADASQLNLTGVDATVFYTSNAMDLLSFTPSNTFNSVIVNGPANPATGTYRIVLANTSSSTISGTVNLGTFRFKTKALPTASNSVNAVINVTSSGQAPQIVAQGVSQALTVNSNSSSFTIANNAPTITQAPTVAISPTVIPTSITIAPTIIPTVTPGVTKSLIANCGTYGDVDNNGVITNNDAQEILQHVAGLQPLVAYNAANADVDMSETVTATDSLYIQRYLAGLPTTYNGTQLSTTSSLPVCFLKLTPTASIISPTVIPTTTGITPTRVPIPLTIEYPYCNNSLCDFSKAICKWNRVSGVTNYRVIITNLTSSNTVATQTVPQNNPRAIFPVTNNITYACNVAAVLANGTTFNSGYDSLLIRLEGAATPTPTQTIASSPTVVATSVPTSTPTIAPTNIPTVTVQPNATSLLATLLLPEIVQSTRTHAGDAYIYSLNNQPVARVPFVVSFQSRGRFSGPINLGTSFNTGDYLVKLKLKNSLAKQLPGTVHITKGEETRLPEVRLIMGDINNDNILNILDYNYLLTCARNTATAANLDCSLADLNDDGKVEEIDLNTLFRAFANQEGDPLTLSSIVTMQNNTYSPSNLTLSPSASGTYLITWTNNDSHIHSVTANNNSFDSGDIYPGQSYSRSFPNGANISYHCKYHENMTGTISIGIQ